MCQGRQINGPFPEINKLGQDVGVLGAVLPAQWPFSPHIASPHPQKQTLEIRMFLILAECAVISSSAALTLTTLFYPNFILHQHNHEPLMHLHLRGWCALVVQVKCVSNTD